MVPIHLCEKYRDALSKKDLSRVRELFTADAIIEGPILGTASVAQFHCYLFSHVRKAFASFPNILKSRDTPCSVALQFSYTFTTEKSCLLVVLDGVLKFEIDDSLSKIKRLSYVYNSTDLRNMINSTGIAPPAWSLTAETIERLAGNSVTA